MSSGKIRRRAVITFNMLGGVGGFGNQLFEIAATIGVARRNRADYAFPPWRYAQFFKGPLPQVSRAALEFPTITPKTFAYSEIDVAMSINLLGYFQTEKYFRHCAKEVRQVLSPRPEVEAPLRAWLGDLRQALGGDARRPVCAVHVRRGDYVGHDHYVDLAATSYYENAFRHFGDNTIFVVFSDDIPWCKIRFSGWPMVYVEADEIKSLVLMSLCDAIIIANSSYSWWGAWLTDRTGRPVIAPDRWFAGELADPEVPFDPIAFRGYHDACDIIPDRWRIESIGA